MRCKPADLAARSEYVFVLMHELADLEADLSGPSGLQAGVHSPTILVVGAISPPDDLRSLAGDLAEKTAGLLRVVDAPLSGTQAAAACGELSIVVGAAPGLYRDSLPVLELLGTCVRVGGVGSAQIANACGQYVIAATAMAVSEAAVIAERAGLDLSRVLHSWELSLAGSRVLAAAQAKLLNRDFEPDLPAGAALAPLEVASQQAWRTGTTARLVANVRELFRAVGSSRPEQSGSDVDLPVPEPHSTLSAGKHRVNCWDAQGASERRESGRGGQPHARIAGPGFCAQVS